MWECSNRVSSLTHLQTPAAWPTEEVEWLASTAYNHSVDLWCYNKVEACRWWAEKAIALAHYSDDGGQLEARLHENYVKNKLGDP